MNVRVLLLLVIVVVVCNKVHVACCLSLWGLMQALHCAWDSNDECAWHIITGH